MRNPFMLTARLDYFKKEVVCKIFQHYNTFCEDLHSLRKIKKVERVFLPRQKDPKTAFSMQGLLCYKTAKNVAGALP